MLRVQKSLLNLVLATVLACPKPAPAADQVLILGDSLSKEYSLEFALDGYPASVINWIEILGQLRGDDMDVGSGGAILDSRFLFFKQQYNWAIPGGKIEDFVEIITQGGFANNNARNSIASQLQNNVERFVLFVGGNDSDSKYAAPYNGTGNWDSFIAQFVSDCESVIDWAMTQNPNLEFALVNVPHVGITPKVKGEYPPDPVKTGRVTTEYIKLNNALLTLAQTKDIAYADIFTETLDLLGPDPLCIHGVPFSNTGSASGNLNNVWLAGNLSDNFHPNTNGNALIANRILEAFNLHYDSGLKLLTTEEILETLLSKNADISYNDWLTCYGLAGTSENYLLHFGLGIDPRRPDPNRLPRWELTPTTASLTYRPRLSEPSSIIQVIGQYSDDLNTWINATNGQVTMNPDGSLTYQIDATARNRFQRLATIGLPQ
ncbi:MAG: SGNH/GDSL hydrolase family protein [Verrucomicrobiota bacterium]